MHFDIGRTLSLCLLLATTLTAKPLLGFHHKNKSKAPALPNPNVDAFYKAPGNLDRFKKGQVIRSRAVNTTISSDKAKASFQILYRTTDTLNNSEVTVATIWQPYNPKKPQQILSYHSYMDSVSADCAPSYAWLNVSDSKGKVIGETNAPKFIEWALSNGIYALDPDDEGPKAAFIAGFQQGQSALDGMRATRDFFQLPKDTGIAMTGYSGGASVTAWAANLAGSYAPDLNILGACHGGTPLDTRNLLNHLNGGLFAGFAGAGIVGLMNAYPDLDKFIMDHISESGAKVINKYRSRGRCIQYVVTGNFYRDFFKLVNVTNPLDEPIPKAVLARESLLMNVSSVGVNVPKFPRYLWHAHGDQVIPFSDQQVFVGQQCKHGANIQFNVLQWAEHVSAEFKGHSGAINFLGQVFNGTTPSVKCGTTLPINATTPVDTS